MQTYLIATRVLERVLAIVGSCLGFLHRLQMQYGVFPLQIMQGRACGSVVGRLPLTSNGLAGLHSLLPSPVSHQSRLCEAVATAHVTGALPHRLATWLEIPVPGFGLGPAAAKGHLGRELVRSCL